MSAASCSGGSRRSRNLSWPWMRPGTGQRRSISLSYIPKDSVISLHKLILTLNNYSSGPQPFILPPVYTVDVAALQLNSLGTLARQLFRITVCLYVSLSAYLSSQGLAS